MRTSCRQKTLVFSWLFRGVPPGVATALRRIRPAVAPVVSSHFGYFFYKPFMNTTRAGTLILFYYKMTDVELDVTQTDFE
jgi:hypothetical protein